MRRSRWWFVAGAGVAVLAVVVGWTLASWRSVPVRPAVRPALRTDGAVRSRPGGGGAAPGGRGGPAGVAAQPGSSAQARLIAYAESLPGDSHWGDGVTFSLRSPVAGFADRASVLPGQVVHLYINATYPPVRVSAFRMGWYHGAEGHCVATYPAVSDVHQPPDEFIPVTRTVSDANWHPSLTVDTTGWIPGDYLFLLQDAAGHGRWIPLTVRSPSVAGDIVLVNADTTWQAYNAYGGYSLYHGPDGSYQSRSYAVSFDRPIDYGGGSGDFYGNELPVVALAEKLGLPVAYVTDTDLDADPHLLDGARALISLGHDEYWSTAMRDQVQQERDLHGMNVAFLGANAIYRHIRMAATPLGPERLEIDYKDGALDPMNRINPAEATYQWRDGPDPRPESVLTGAFYQCNPVHAAMRVFDAASWLFTGTPVQQGMELPGLAGQEFDMVDLAVPTPRPMDVLFHSPVTCRGHHLFQDTVYYTTPSGAGGFDSGTSAWICGLTPACSRGNSPAARAVITTVTTNLLQAFAAGPAGRTHPARDDVAALGMPTLAAPAPAEP
ncbi:conserved hypothetical protein [Acidothermus cellulolyticus 11B]|uniref:N,N-dimethylformamidase beta subunit-like C-terminal domain-containing protein n=1 Tax=Acidothermus cellulolyticus (strain ATCC 43068 / DSM 8971 / 11B) TaxID=351607 RepID=A0LTB7_ACIC1|nr:N,N-dimethylformamidase beta subunit family domain-containing protein [Acidothermus cellulolyticus]ABK52677.1 conserved hypothetical protein [Acidothermus cellulolyticus 11B]